MTQLPAAAALPESAVDPTSDDWYRDAVLYQIYPRSFADANGDGVGDLRGIIDHLPHLEWLGVDGIWLSPINVSPNHDYGYDVADYYDVDPTLGTLADIDELIAQARARGIRVLMDLVPNHTSSENAWFQEAASSRDSLKRDWYVWADPAADGGLPNNWVAAFHGPAWTWHEATQQYYLHLFLPEQPDLNWWNPEVRTEFDQILRFWLDRGIAGFRIDVCHGIVKDHELRDDPPLEPDAGKDPWEVNRRDFSMNRPEVHGILKGWRGLSDEYHPGGVLIGETWADSLPKLMRFYGDGSDELHLAFNFEFTMGQLEAGTLSHEVAETERLLPGTAWPVWTLSNHDISRYGTRWAGGDVRKIRAAMLLMLGLRGTPVLYYGDEIGMTDGIIAPEQVRDMRQFQNTDGVSRPTRDPVRTPMQWTPAGGAGFTADDVEPWLPLQDQAEVNVEAQRDDPGSMLSLTRALIGLRRQWPALRSGAYTQLESPQGTWLWQRGDEIVVGLNLTDTTVTVDDFTGAVVVVGTDHRRTDETIGSSGLTLRPWEGVVLAIEPA